MLLRSRLLLRTRLLGRLALLLGTGLLRLPLLLWRKIGPV